MKSIKKILMATTVLLSFTTSNAQIKNAKTATVKISGNCGMCETIIEKAGNLKKTAQVDWNKDTGIATLTYDSEKTNQDEILKGIALAGYDSEKFLASDDVYNNLHGCCQYDREFKVAEKIETKSDTNDSEQAKLISTTENQSGHGNPNAVTNEKQQANQLKPVFDNYFLLKDALVKSDGKTASIHSKELLSAINSVKMESLKTDVHTVWMKILNEVTDDATQMSRSQDIKHQRDLFVTLSENLHQLLKVAKAETTTYYQFCPMANGGKGANWLSKESTIKNPYYGSKMLSCGKTVEMIK